MMGGIRLFTISSRCNYRFLKIQNSSRMLFSGDSIELIINNFNHEINNFQQVCPIEMLQKLKNPISLKTTIKKVI